MAVTSKNKKSEVIDAEATIEPHALAKIITPPFRIVKPAAVMQSLNILIYGKSGSGKTFLAGSAAEDKRCGKILMAEAESGTLSIRHQEAIDVAPIDSISTLTEVYNFLSEEEHQYQTVIMDSLTEIQKRVMYGIMEGVVAVKPERDPDLPQLQEWGKNAEVMRKLVRYFRDLPMHFICTCLEAEQKDERTGEITIGPSLPGKLQGEVPAFFDVVGRLYTQRVTGPDGSQQIVRRLMVQPTGKYLAKDRSGSLGADIEQPTIGKLLDAIGVK